MVDDEVAVVIGREFVLLTPEVRGSPHQLGELLDPDFEEIGKSGRLWKRAEMISALVADTNLEEHSIKVSEMNGRTVGPGPRALDLHHAGRRAAGTTQFPIAPVNDRLADPAPPGDPGSVNGSVSVTDPAAVTAEGPARLRTYTRGRSANGKVRTSRWSPTAASTRSRSRFVIGTGPTS